MAALSAHPSPQSHTPPPPTPRALLTHLLDDPDHPAAPQLLQGRAQCADGPEPQAAETLRGETGSGPSPPQPGSGQGLQLLGEHREWARMGCGPTSPHRDRLAGKLVLTWAGGPHCPLHSGPPPTPQPFSKAQGVLKASEAALESPTSRRQMLQGWGNNLRTCGSQGTCLEDQGMCLRHLIWGKVSLGGVRVHVCAHLWAREVCVHFQPPLRVHWVRKSHMGRASVHI